MAGAAFEKKFSTALDSQGSYLFSSKIGLSNLFNLDIATEIINQNVKTNNKYVDKFLKPGSRMIRGGGTAIFLSQQRGDFLTTGMRLSYGRVLSNTRPGYMFADIIISYQINDYIKSSLIKS